MAEEMDMEITQAEANTAIVAFLSPSMSDVDTISAASTQIKNYVKEHRPRALIFDFEAVKFFSSLVLGLLLDVRGRMASYHGEVLISGINPQLHRVFKITNLDKIFRFFPNRRKAVEAATSN
ncbi:MAG: STAS domain-containing protein [Sedimentisphaerales bacterium]|nr:STAS domain-containing protein [Sedimentisphaerales bacterium]